MTTGAAQNAMESTVVLAGFGSAPIPGEASRHVGKRIQRPASVE